MYKIELELEINSVTSNNEIKEDHCFGKTVCLLTP